MAMKKYVRVVTEATIENKDVAPFTIDLIIDDEGNIVGEHLIFAYQCFAQERKAWSNPLVIDLDGVTDWGIGYENSIDQYGETDLRHKRIIPGAILRFWGTGYNETFRITQLITFVSEQC
jgi:hypothetical protein